MRGNLLILSYAFPPSVGGIETVSRILARTFAQRGYAVTVATEIAGDARDSEEPYRVVRRPGALQLMAEIYRADLVLQSNISLRLGWPLWILFPRKPFMLVFHGPIARPDGRLAWQDRLKRALLWRPYFLSVSSYQAEQIRPGSRVIRNPYDSEVFRLFPQIKRDRDLLFVGRLVTAKGVDTLLRAYAMVRQQRPATTLSIIGSGPEEAALQALAASLGIEPAAHFLGAKHGDDLAHTMNRHRILVVPSHSVPPEACPVVPVEAVACGCVPVASRMGGLPESVGTAGVLFEEGNAEELARTLLDLLDAPEKLETFRAKAATHLRQFQIDAVADAYESHFAACGRP